MNKLLVFFILVSFFVHGARTQSVPFQIHLEGIDIPELGGLQSYAFGQANGKWLIVGGRLDGLHRRQPFAAFDVAGNNNQLMVVDPIAQQKWTASLSALDEALQEQLSSTNMEFYQEGDMLYVVGGYGFHNATQTRKTFDLFTAIAVSQTIEAVINGTDVEPFFRYINDPMFAVTGGHLEKINTTYYLIGGNKFDGNYNPMGNPTYTQVYTDAIRKFNVMDNGTDLSVEFFPSIVDVNAFHRRDYNAVPQILPDGSEGVTVFSGVFQPDVNLPFLNAVVIDSAGYSIQPGFQQYYNHYHCAVLPMYDAAQNEMHNVFFGGIAQYYDDGGVLVQDNNVPFVRAIARVTRSSDNVMAEYKLPVEMPGLLGAGSEFIPLPTVPHAANGVIQMDQLTGDSVLVGYIYGGISSTAANIFFSNTGTQSSASSQIFKVYIIRNGKSGLDVLNPNSNSDLQLRVFPNPNDGHFAVRFQLQTPSEVRLTLYDSVGKTIERAVLNNTVVGENRFERHIKELDHGGTYLLTIETDGHTVTQKIIVER